MVEKRKGSTNNYYQFKYNVELFLTKDTGEEDDGVKKDLII